MVAGAVAETKTSRLEQLLPGGKGVWIPIDHGASDFPCPGLEDLEQTIRGLVEAGVNAIVAQKGVVDRYHELCKGTNTAMVVHYSVSTRHAGEDQSNKVLVGHADETLSRGGIAVSSQVNMGSPNEASMIERMGELNRQAHHLALPSFGMVYARGEHLNPVDGDATNGQIHAVRLAFELGCDAAKTTWIDDDSAFNAMTACVPIPVLVAGGPRTDDTLEVLTRVERAMALGAGGVCMGRQVFAHPDMVNVAKSLMSIVHDGLTAKDAMALHGL